MERDESEGMDLGPRGCVEFGRGMKQSQVSQSEGKRLSVALYD